MHGYSGINKLVDNPIQNAEASSHEISIVDMKKLLLLGSIIFSCQLYAAGNEQKICRSRNFHTRYQ